MSWIPQRRQVTVSYKGTRRDVELLQIDEEGRELEIGAAHSWNRMVAAAARDGIKLKARTAFRDRDYQQKLYDRWKAYSAYEFALKIWTEGGKVGEPPKEVPYASGANKPGTSEHEIGNAVDCDLRGPNDKHNPVDGPIEKWLKAYAEKYGWVFPVKSERWHAVWKFGPSIVGP